MHIRLVKSEGKEQKRQIISVTGSQESPTHLVLRNDINTHSFAMQFALFSVSGNSNSTALQFKQRKFSANAKKCQTFALHEKCPNTEFFCNMWSVFSRIQTEYGFGHFSRSADADHLTIYKSVFGTIFKDLLIAHTTCP